MLDKQFLHVCPLSPMHMELTHCKVIHTCKKNSKVSLVYLLLMLWHISVKTKLITKQDPDIVFLTLPHSHFIIFKKN